MDLKLEDLKKSLGRMYSRIPPMVGRSRIFQPGCCRGERWRSSSEDSSVVPSAGLR